MKPMTMRTLLATVALVCATVAAPAHADRETRNTLLGAGVGGVAGALLSNGDPLVTIGGAAAGGLLGNLATPEPRYERRGWHSPRRAEYRPRHVSRHWHGRHHHRHHRR